jgi:hypothetical protein
MKLQYLTDPGQIIAWARKLVQDLSRAWPEEYPGPYTNDTAAASAGIQLGQSYMDTSGIYRRRIV